MGAARGCVCVGGGGETATAMSELQSWHPANYTKMIQIINRGTDVHEAFLLSIEGNKLIEGTHYLVIGCMVILEDIPFASLQACTSSTTGVFRC